MRLFRIFISTAFWTAVIAVVVTCVFSLVTGRSELSLPGVIHTLREIEWVFIFALAAFFGLLNVLSQFAMFRWLGNLFWWVEILLKAVTGRP
jgi:hypothetical protein